MFQQPEDQAMIGFRHQFFSWILVGLLFSAMMMQTEKFVGRLCTEGFFGFAGHGDPVQYRNIKIKQIK
jgi:hypothetical protein